MHTHYKGTGRVHSFKGLIDSSGQDEINIEGSVGAIAWRITKFELLPYEPSATSQESIIKIYREKHSTVDRIIDFSDNELLGAAIWSHMSALGDDAINTAVIFDNALFVRNIWVTHLDPVGTNQCNYYIELEEVTVSAAGKAQLAVAAARRTLN